MPSHSALALNVPTWIMLLCLLATGATACNSPENPSSQGTQTSIARDLEVVDFMQQMGAENALVLDVRSDGEWAEGHLEGAAYIPFQSDNFAELLGQLPHDRPVLVYCAAGGRSAKAMEILNQSGHPEVYNLLGGIRAWQADGHPVVNTPPVTIQ